MKEKKVPMRMCVGCREMKPKKQLIRIVRDAEGAVLVDLKGKSPGRGAYVCPQSECVTKAVKIRALDRALEVKVDAQIEGMLKQQIESRSDG
ncbi:MAG: RNase P modulator RnpM [Christensenellales bacterium]